MAMYEKGDELERSTERRKPGTISWESFRNGWALVTGASEGLGHEFARQLAQKGLNLVLVARNETRLERFSFELVQTHGITTRTIPMDLS